MTEHDPRPGDRVTLFELARATDSSSGEWSKIGRVTAVNETRRRVHVTLEPRYSNGVDPALSPFHVSGRADHGTVPYTVVTNDADEIEVHNVPFDHLDVIEPPDVIMTPSQMLACLIGPWAGGYGVAPEHGLAISQRRRGHTPAGLPTEARDPWLIVEDAENVGTEGSGVYMDTGGAVHYSPGFPEAEPTDVILRVFKPDDYGREVLEGLVGEVDAHRIEPPEGLFSGAVVICVVSNFE